MPLSARRNQPPTCSTPRSVRALSPTWIRISVRSSIIATAAATSPVVEAFEEHLHRVRCSHGRSVPAAIRSRRRAPPPPPPEPPPPNPPPPPPEPDDAGEFPMVPSAAIMPPKLGIGEELIRPGAQPPGPPPDAASRSCRCRTRPGSSRTARRPDLTSSAVRSRTCSTSDWRPSATPQTTASSGVSISGIAAVCDDLAHRPRLRHRLLERPPIGLEHRPDHGAGHRPRGHARGQDQHHDPGRRSGPRRGRRARPTAG